MKRGLSVLVSVAIGVLALAGCADRPTAAAAATGTGEAGSSGITARGLGTATGAPDTATLVLGVQTRAAGAAEALDANSARANALIEVLKSRGVADADLQTSQLSINPTYGPDAGQITGYEVTNLVTATLHDVAAAGGLIDAAGEVAGDAVRVQQISFAIDDDSDLRAQARADAVRRAQAQAQQMADAAGVALGPIRSITEVPTGGPSPYRPDARSSVADAAAAPPVEAGSQELTVLVDVVYELGR